MARRAFWDNVHRVMTEKNVTFTALSKETGLTWERLWDIVMRHKNYTVDEAVKIARALNTTPRKLVYDL